MDVDGYKCGHIGGHSVKIQLEAHGAMWAVQVYICTASGREMHSTKANEAHLHKLGGGGGTES